MLFNDNVLDKIQSCVGKFTVISQPRQESSRTGVMEICTDEGRQFVKIHNRISRSNPEIFAYRNWMPAIGHYAPELLHIVNADDLCAIILTPISGKTVNEVNLQDTVLLEKVYFEAGRILKVLHSRFQGAYFGIPAIDGTPLDKKVETDACEYVMKSIYSIYSEGIEQEIFNGSEEVVIEWCEKNIQVFNGCKPVPTNWDYSPNNWMIEDGKFTGIIDFENVLWGIDYDSFGVITERYTYDKPHLLKAFLEGYGYQDTNSNHIRMNILMLKMAMAEMVFGHSNNLTRNLELGRKMFERIRTSITEDECIC